VPQGDEAGAEVQAQEGELRHPDVERDHADEVDQAQRQGHDVCEFDGQPDAGQAQAAKQSADAKADLANSDEDLQDDLAEDKDAGDEHVDGVAGEAQEEHKVDQEAEAEQSAVEAFGVDAGGDAGAETGEKQVHGGVGVGGRDGDDQVGGSCCHFS